MRKLVNEENLKPWTRDGEDGGVDWTGVPTKVFLPVRGLRSSASISALPLN